jgi:hypothetical protein
MNGRMPKPAPLVGLALFAASLALARGAHAQNSDESKAQAVQLFDDAERLVAAGRYSEACPKYAESNRLDPQLGVLLYLADCYEKNGQLASAWGSFRAASEIAEQRADPRASVAKSRAQALMTRINHLTIQVPEEARVPGLIVTRDGAPVAEALFGSAVAVDAGEHVIRAEAPGYRNLESKLDVAGEGNDARFTLATLRRIESSESSSGRISTTEPPETPGAGSSQRIVAIAVGGVGLIGLGIGGVFGLSAQSAQSDSNPLCNERNVCTKEGDELRDTAKSRALVATIASSAGGAALAGAAILWLTAPSPKGSEAADRLSVPRLGFAVGTDSAALWLHGEL